MDYQLRIIISFALMNLSFLSCSNGKHFIGDDEYVIIVSRSLDEPVNFSHKEVKEIEKIIKEEVNYYKSKHAKEIKRYEDLYDEEIDKKELSFGRQYVASFNEKKEKLVLIDFFCNPDDLFKNWRTELKPPVEDGGNCYFRFKVNLTTKKILYQHANGVAFNNNNNNNNYYL